MRGTSIFAVVLMITCTFCVPDSVGAQNRDWRRLDDARVQDRIRQERRQQEVDRIQAEAALNEGVESAAWRAVRLFRMAGQPAMLGIVIDEAEDGVTVKRISPGGPAEEGGIEPGDLIIGVNGTPIAANKRSSPTETLLMQIGEVDFGDTVRFTVQRGDGAHDVDVSAREIGPQIYYML